MPAAIYIKHALLERNITQKELAKKLNTSSSNLSKMLINDNINYNKVEEIANLLDYDIIWQKKEITKEIQQINNSGIMNIGIQNNQK